VLLFQQSNQLIILLRNGVTQKFTKIIDVVLKFVLLLKGTLVEEGGV
jgi:hypothetical protein